jgi:hypothetical protein
VNFLIQGTKEVELLMIQRTFFGIFFLKKNFWAHIRGEKYFEITIVQNYEESSRNPFQK